MAPERKAAFEQAYGADGDWARFFQRAAAFRGVELLRGMSDDREETAEAPSEAYYWAIDRWDSREAYEDFNARFEREYEDLDMRLAELCEADVCLGKFEVVA